MKWMWSLGDYGEVAKRLMPHAEILAEAAGVCAGMSVLDVAAGNGNFAIAAARRGARVTASDLTPHMVEIGRARAVAEGLAIEWLEADAEDLPFDTGHFDLAASVFGAMFAPQPERVAAELVRVVRPGGFVAMANYSDEGFLGQFSQLLHHYGPPAPNSLQSPFLWGDDDEIRRRFQGLTSSVEVTHHSLSFGFDSAEHALAFWEATNGPFIALRTLISPDIYHEVSEQAVRLLKTVSRTEGGRIFLDSGYRQVIARKSGSTTS
jgi:SAM-dependent methyltransferase